MPLHPHLDSKISVTGRPLTPELRQLFSAFGDVVGIAVSNDGAIEVQYQGFAVRYVPELKR